MNPDIQDPTENEEPPKVKRHIIQTTRIMLKSENPKAEKMKSAKSEEMDGSGRKYEKLNQKPPNRLNRVRQQA